MLSEQYAKVYEGMKVVEAPKKEEGDASAANMGPGGVLEVQPDGQYPEPPAKDENGEYVKNADGTGSVRGPGTPFGQPGNNPIPKTKLTPQEEAIIKQNYDEMINAVKSGDLQKAYQVLKNMERLINASQPQQVNSENQNDGVDKLMNKVARPEDHAGMAALRWLINKASEGDPEEDFRQAAQRWMKKNNQFIDVRNIAYFDRNGEPVYRQGVERGNFD